MGSCGNRPPQCVICSDPHKIEENCCGVADFNKDKGKTCVHVTIKCGNCGRSHLANSNQCTKGHRAEMRARKNRVVSKGKTKIVELDNTQDKMPDEVNSEPKANSEPDVGFEPETSYSLSEASPNQDNITSDLDMGMDLDLKAG